MRLLESLLSLGLICGCGRVGFDGIGEPHDAAIPTDRGDGRQGVAEDAGALVDAASMSPDAAAPDAAPVGPLGCGGNAGPGCALTTAGLSIGGEVRLPFMLVGHAEPIAPTCGGGLIAEGRANLVAPTMDAILTFRVEADVSTMLTILAEDCAGASLLCERYTVAGDESFELVSTPGQRLVASVASNACGSAELVITGRMP